MEQALLGSSMRVDPEDQWISDLDPILEGGFKVMFKQQLCIEVRSTEEDGSSAGVKDIFTIRILTRSQGQKCNEMKMEINSESNIFTVYICRLDEKRFERMKKQQGLNFGYASLLSMLTKQIGLCDRNLAQYSTVLMINRISAHRLDFIENIEYKRIELISFDFEELDAESTKNYITYRFTKAKAKSQLIQTKFREVLAIVKLKNPNLLGAITKNVVANDPTASRTKGL